MDKSTIKDVKYKEDAECEHCGVLEPFTALIEDGADYCIDCAEYSSTVELSKCDLKQIELQQTMYQIKYHKERLNTLFDDLGKQIREADETIFEKLTIV